MTSRSGALFVLALAAALAGCKGPRTPAPLARPSPTPAIAALQQGGAPALQPYLDAYPIGSLGMRTDLIASTREHSMHFVQARRALPSHIHPSRTETVYVLTGTGTCYIGEKSYPITAGSAFRFAPGVAHSAFPDEGQTIVAISYFEPPLLDGDDRVPAPPSR